MDIAYSILVTVTWFLSMYFTILILLVLIFNRRKLYSETAGDGTTPVVSIIISAFNEQKTIQNCIESLSRLEYPKDKLEIVVVNDGSTDDTCGVVSHLASKSGLVFIDNKANKGKAACLNQGILASKGTLVACMDADTEVEPDILKKTVPYFKDGSVAAVTVSVEVKDPKNLIEKIISMEYLIGLSLYLKALSFLGSINVTPGPFSIFKKSILVQIGLFDKNNITEDLEIAYRIHKFGYKIENCMSAKVRTITPNSLKQLYVQRKRWYSGALHTVSHHKSILFDKKLGFFGFVIPYMFLLIFVGMSLFFYALFLSAKNLVTSMSYYSLTNFNFFDHNPFNIDLMTINLVTFFGVTTTLTLLINAVVCIKLAKLRVRHSIWRIFGLLMIFPLYQVFWTSSVITVLFRRKVKWR